MHWQSAISLNIIQFKVLTLFSYVSLCSSLSQWVHACDALALTSQQREQLDSFIDQLYKDVEKGHNSLPTLKNSAVSCDICTVYEEYCGKLSDK